jgi:hypothetical protein
MTYDEYIAETKENCKSVLADCSFGELEDIERLRKLLWEDDRVTGVISGFCTSTKGNAQDLIKDVIFDDRFLEDFNKHELNMQSVMAYGPEAIDVVIRCLSLKYISIVELAEKERVKRSQKDKEARRYSAVRI